MTSKPEDEKAPGSQTPANQTPTEKPGQPAHEISEDELKQVAGGASLWGEGKKIKIDF